MVAKSKEKGNGNGRVAGVWNMLAVLAGLIHVISKE